jgi:hypothetical protein
MRPTYLKTFLLIAFIASVFYWRPIWSSEYTILSGFENTNQAYAWYHFVANSIKHTQAPTWDPYTFGGRDFPGEMQTGAFYPLNLVMAASPFGKSGFFSSHVYNYFYLLSRVLGAFFMFLLAREFERSYFASLLAGFCFSFGGVVCSMIAWPDRYNSVIWLPLGMLFAIRAVEGGGKALRYFFAALCGVVLGLPILAGGLHIVIMQMIILVTALAAYAVFQRKSLDAVQWRTCWITTAAVLAIALAFAAATGAVQLLSSLEYSGLSTRWVDGGALPSDQKIPYERLNDGVLPNGLVVLLLGSPASEIANGEFLNPYLGVLTLFLALIGIWQAWRNQWVKYLTALAILAFAYSLASYSFLHGALYVLVPRLWMAREANRFLYMADFALPILAAFGVDALLDGSLGESAGTLRRVMRWVGGGALASLVLPALYRPLSISPWISMSLLLILASCGVIAYVLRGNTGTIAKLAILLLILSDLYAFDWGARSIQQANARGENQFKRLYSAKPAVDFVKSQPGMYRLGVSVDMPPSIGLLYGVQTNSGTGATMQTDFDSIRHRDDLWNVKYMLKPASAKEPNPVYQDNAWKVYATQEPCPRAWIVHQVEHRGDPKATVERLDNADFKPLQTAVITGPEAPPLDPPAPGAVERARITNYEQNRIRLKVDSAGRGLLVMSENYYPGWKATVNGRATRILKVDGGLRGIPVSGGSSTVELRYSPLYMTLGLPITCLALLFGLAAPFVYRFRLAPRTRRNCEATA